MPEREVDNQVMQELGSSLPAFRRQAMATAIGRDRGRDQDFEQRACGHGASLAFARSKVKRLVGGSERIASAPQSMVKNGIRSLSLRRWLS